MFFRKSKRPEIVSYASEKEELIDEILIKLSSQKKGTSDFKIYLFLMQSFVSVSALFFSFYMLSRPEISHQAFSVYTGIALSTVALWFPSPFNLFQDK